MQVAYHEVYEIAMQLLHLDLSPYCMLWILEFCNAMIAVKRHIATIKLLQGLYNSRNKIRNRNEN